MDKTQFLEYLKENYPHLHDVELGIRGIQNSTGFGEISFSLRIINGIVDKINLTTDVSKLYHKRQNNKLIWQTKIICYNAN